VLLLLIIAWLVVVLPMSAWVGLRGWRLWKTARSAQRQVEGHLSDARLQDLPDRIAELERGQQRLADALARLQTSVAEFAVLWHAVGGVRHQAAGVRGFFRK
jgi:ABC-type phosphate transport system auxiliary subunit